MEVMYFVTAIRAPRKPLLARFAVTPSSRCFGFFCIHEDAVTAIEINACDLNGGEFDYAVIEQIPEGIMARAEQAWWYRWDEDHYTPIDVPEFAQSIFNWAIG